jgi:two-component system chemotaxis response regulator CheY
MGVGSVFGENNATAAWRHYLDDNNVPLDLIICDWMMPGMSGLELLELVRERDPKVPFIMLTVVSKPKSVQTAFASGASGYLLKPFAIDALQKKALSFLI